MWELCTAAEGSYLRAGPCWYECLAFRVLTGRRCQEHAAHGGARVVHGNLLLPTQSAKLVYISVDAVGI